MEHDIVFSPHDEFFIDELVRDKNFEMSSFHFHKRHEIYYLFEGASRYFIGDSAYLISAGDLVVVHSDIIHKTSATGKEGFRRTVINFHEDLLHPLCDVDGVDLFACFSGDNHVINVPMRSRGLVESLLKRLLDYSTAETPTAQFMQKLLLTELLVYINDFAASQKEREYALVKNQLISDIQQYITEHYQEDLNLTSIAARFYISPSYLSRLFKRVTSLSIVEYINSVRTMAAKGLLEKTNLKIPEVAHEAGFSTGVHFTRIFKDGTGHSPQQYRKLYRQTSKQWST